MKYNVSDILDISDVADAFDILDVSDVSDMRISPVGLLIENFFAIGIAMYYSEML